MASKPLLQPRWVVIGVYRTCPLPMKPIPPYMKPTKWPPAYFLRSKRPPIKVDTDAATVTGNTDSPPDGGAG